MRPPRPRGARARSWGAPAAGPPKPPLDGVQPGVQPREHCAAIELAVREGPDPGVEEPHALAAAGEINEAVEQRAGAQEKALLAEFLRAARREVVTGRVQCPVDGSQVHPE